MFKYDIFGFDFAANQQFAAAEKTGYQQQIDAGQKQ
jgi:hypothetical protein